MVRCLSEGNEHVCECSGTGVTAVRMVYAWVLVVCHDGIDQVMKKCMGVVVWV